MDDETKRSFDMLYDMQQKQAELMDRVRPVYREPIPIYDRWGWLRRGESNVNINDRSNDWLPVALILGAILLALWWPRPEPAKPVIVSPAPSLGTATWQKQRKDGSWETISSASAKELPDGRIQTQDGRIWIRNPDGTLSEVK